MPTPNQVLHQINRIVGCLIEIGLADDQCFALRRGPTSGVVEVTFEGADHVSIALRDRAYEEIYRHLVEARSYNLRMLDGALVQMMYKYLNGTLHSHRLAFFPSPYLEDFQSEPDVYLDDELHADVIDRNIVPFPLRFDYDVQSFVELHHPMCHLTLGQYPDCRIPVTAPVTPVRFADFILRNFYHTTFARYADKLPRFSRTFGTTILPSERELMHVVCP